MCAPGSSAWQSSTCSVQRLTGIPWRCACVSIVLPHTSQAQQHAPCYLTAVTPEQRSALAFHTCCLNDFCVPAAALACSVHCDKRRGVLWRFDHCEEARWPDLCNEWHCVVHLHRRDSSTTPSSSLQGQRQQWKAVTAGWRMSAAAWQLSIWGVWASNLHLALALWVHTAHKRVGTPNAGFCSNQQVRQLQPFCAGHFGTVSQQQW